MIKMNFHTHSCYCDGKNTPTEIAEEAMKQGLEAIGFSGHAYTSFDESYAMSPDGTKEYRKEIETLKAIYLDQMTVLCGIEQDYFSDGEIGTWDYVIGSVHYVKKDGKYISVDESAEITRKAIDDYYGGDVYSFADDYFKLEEEIVEKTNCNIIGHFDLLTKFNEIDTIFDTENPRYVKAYMKALDNLADTGIPFEINTGAISRGYRHDPYPAISILKEIFRRNGKITLSSDSHEKSTLLFGFDEAETLAKEIGFKKVTVFGHEGSYEIEIYKLKNKR